MEKSKGSDTTVAQWISEDIFLLRHGFYCPNVNGHIIKIDLTPSFEGKDTSN